MAEALINMADIQTKIKDQVKVTFFNLLPDDKFQELVSAEVNAFFNEGQHNIVLKSVDNSGGYYTKTVKVELMAPGVTPFRGIVWGTLTELINPLIGDAVRKTPEFQNMIVTNGFTETGMPIAVSATLSTAASELMAAMIPKMIEQMFATTFATNLDAIKNRLVDEIGTATRNRNY